MTSPIVGRNRNNVMVGAPDVSVSGGFFVGPEATDPTEYPKNHAEAIADIITRLKLDSTGYITSDGVSESEDRSTEKILDWNLDVIDIVETDYGIQLSVTFAEARNAAVLKYIYGDDNVDIDEDGTVHIKKGARQLENKAILFELKGKGNLRGRGFAAATQVQSIGEITYTKSGLIQYPATIDILSDSEGGYLHTWFGAAKATVPGGEG